MSPKMDTRYLREPSRVCVIGAGPGGLSILSAFNAAEVAGIKLPEVVCYEAQAGIGGLWNFDAHTAATDPTEYKEHKHGVMYRHLWCNAPKETIEYADYPFDQHFGGQIPSYTSSAVMLDYLKGRTAHENLKRFVTFRSQIIGCRYEAKTEQFELSVRSLDEEGAVRTECFDWVISAPGKYTVPNLPEDVPGLEALREEGLVVHAKDFRNPEDYKNKDVLVVGASYSAEDIASLCYKFGAKSVTMSWRTSPPKAEWPSEVGNFLKVVPALQSITGRTAHFKNGEQCHVDAVIHCTGYKKADVFRSFMDDSLRPLAALPSAASSYSAEYTDGTDGTEQSLFAGSYAGIRGLFNGVVSIQNPRKLFVGFASTWSSWNLMEAQSRYAVGVVLGRLELPDATTMAVENRKMNAHDKEVDDAGDDKGRINLETEYVKHLLAESNNSRAPRRTLCPDQVRETLLDWKRRKLDNIMTYRDKSYPSVVTGKMAAEGSKWLDGMDDSIESFVDAKHIKFA